jgi:hypothetical protein
MKSKYFTGGFWIIWIVFIILVVIFASCTPVLYITEAEGYVQGRRNGNEYLLCNKRGENCEWKKLDLAEPLNYGDWIKIQSKYKN